MPARAEIAQLCGVALATITHSLKQRRESGHLIPKAMIASLPLQGMGEALILEGAADACTFELYVEQILTPSLQSVPTGVMDNLSIHQGVRVRKAIEARGYHVLSLPSYSPDFSPLEEAFSKLKPFLRRGGARTREALQEAITAQDAHGWFTHCGYLAEEPSCSDSEATMAQSL